MTLASIIVVIILLLMSGVCSAIETAFTAASPSKIHKIKASGNKIAQRGLDLIKIKDKVISTFLIVYSILNTFATTLATSMFISVFGDEGAFISSMVMAGLIIIFAEVIPKAIAVARPENLVVYSSRFVKYCLKLMAPINLSLSYILKFFCFVFKINLVQQTSALDEMRSMIRHYHVEGDVHKIDRDMIDGVLDVSHMLVYDVMIHRSKIDSISCDLPIENIITQALNLKHSKLPLWKGNTENIVGVLDVKKIFSLLHKNNFDYKKIYLKDAIMEPWFIPETLPVKIQLQHFKGRSDQIAFVIDEYGDLQGMFTFKDIIDEIVGHVSENKNIDCEMIRKSGNKYIIDGAATIREINRELDWNLPEEEANTIAGLIMRKLGTIPEKGKELELFGLKITIGKKIANKILNVIVQIKQDKLPN